MSTAEALAVPKPDYDQLVELLDVVRYMGVEKDLDRLLSYIADHTVKAMNADRCSIFLLDERNHEIYSRLSHGEEEIRFSADTGIAGECIRTGVCINISEPYKHPLFNKEVDQATGYKTENLICLPLTNLEDKVIGCFEVINKKEGAFAMADQALLAAFGSQAAIALESALLYREAQMSERLATVGKLVATIAHDFRSPMSTILGINTLIRRAPDLPREELMDLFDIIERELKRCTNMTDELLEFSRGTQHLNLSKVSVSEIFEDIAGSLSGQADQQGVTFEYTNDVSHSIEIDEGKIRRVIFNIANNAFDALKGKGKFCLKVEEEQGFISVLLSDNGPGIPAEVRRHMFDAFYTAGKPHGTGLGLHIAKEIIEAHRGSLGLLEEGQGTTFKIKIPLSAAAAT